MPPPQMELPQRPADSGWVASPQDTQGGADVNIGPIDRFAFRLRASFALRPPMPLGLFLSRREVLNGGVDPQSACGFF